MLSILFIVATIVTFLCLFNSVVSAATCSLYGKNLEKCLSASENGVNCAFCSSAAAGTNCMPESDAKGLPTSVFQCEYQPATVAAKQPVSYANSTDVTLGLGSCSYSATCSAGGVSGVCVSISAGCCSGTVTSNLCPGSDDIKCCTNSKCSTPSGSGTCMQTSLSSSKGGKSVSGYCTGPTDLQCCVTGGGGGVSRSTMISRMQSWVDAKVPYSQTDYYQGYRQDCSGYVAMGWIASQPGLSTYYYEGNYCYKISKSQMLEGDALLNPSHHVLMFHKWADSTQDTFWEYAEHDYGQVASHDTISYSYLINNGYFPCRYNNVA